MTNEKDQPSDKKEDELEDFYKLDPYDVKCYMEQMQEIPQKNTKKDRGEAEQEDD